MKLIALVFALLVLGSFATSDFDLLEDQFQKWTQFHNKVYQSDTEYLHRMAIFSTNVKRIQELNENSNGGATFKVNKFSDLSPAEFASKYLGYVPSGYNEEREKLTLSADAVAPDSFSWSAQGKITAVKDQRQCGSCWAFSVTENIESVWMIAKGLTPATMKPLAPQQIVDCDRSDGGCNGGDTPTAYRYVQSAGGLETEAAYPYRAVNQACHFNRQDVFATITGFKYATTSRNEDEMKTAVATVAPLSVCVDAEPWQHYSSGVMTRAQCGTSLDHCTQIEGYNTGTNPAYWHVRNSWGADWGEQGYIRLAYGTNTCGVAMEATTATV